MRKEFKTRLEGAGKSGSVAKLVVPFDVKEVWGKGRVPVKGTVNGAPFRTTVVRMGGEYCFCVNQKMREDAGGIGPGDSVKVVLEPDTAPRVVEVPADLKKAIAGNKAAKDAWDNSSYTNRKEFANWIMDAKRAETRQRRLEKAVEMLAAGRNLSDR